MLIDICALKIPLKMKVVVVFGVLIGVLSEIRAMPSEQQRSGSEAVHWYNLFPSSSVKKVPVYYKNEANSIWSDCSKSSDAVKISYVKISPDPPEKGQPFTVNAKVQLSQEVKGGTVQVYIKYRSFIPVVNKTYQLCDLARSVQDPCPLEAGAHEATITQSFPSYSPSGSYTGSIVAKDEGGNELACVKINMTI